MGDLVYYTLIFLLVLLSFILLNRREKKQSQPGAQLPPGSLGWPYVGETLQLYSQDPNHFLSRKQKRHGDIFKTHILGCPCVMLADPEAARFVLVTAAHLFKPTYPRSKERLIGPSALFFHQGEYHARLRKLVQGSLSPEALRGLVPGIAATSLSCLHSFAGGHVVNTFHEMKKLSFEVGTLAIFGHLEAHYKEELEKNYSVVDRGYNSFPINIPGTPFRRALLARKRLSKILSAIIASRRTHNMGEKDLLGSFLMSSKDDKGGEGLTDDQIADNMIGVLFAAQDTTASAITWVLKYLHDDPKLLEAVKGEQKAIQKLITGGDEQALTWTHTRNMPITYKVVRESLRMASIISFTFREAVADVQYKGYFIPKGWKALPLFRNIHHNPAFFKDPHKFDPFRFEVAPKPNTFMPFGNGVHACPGNELAKLETLTFTHHLVTKFRWEVVGAQHGIQYGPFPVPQQGLPARFWETDE